MAAEDVARRRSVIVARWFVIAYASASLAAFLVGKLLVFHLWNENAPYLLQVAGTATFVTHALADDPQVAGIFSA
jgi:hypothetical protein